MSDPLRTARGWIFWTLINVFLVVITVFAVFAFKAIDEHYTPQGPKQMREWHGHYK